VQVEDGGSDVNIWQIAGALFDIVSDIWDE
jgi:hypothetical protein